MSAPDAIPSIHRPTGDLIAEVFANLPEDDTLRIVVATQSRGPSGEPQRWDESGHVIRLAKGWEDALAEKVAQLSEPGSHNDIYFCVTPKHKGTKAPGEHSIRSAQRTSHLTALWVDFDGPDSSSGKGQVDPSHLWTLDQINGFIFNMGIPEPSALIDTGNGWHGWWLLDEPLEWGDEARALLVRWRAYIAEAAIAEGKHLDAVWDAARVLRVPGTRNWKHGHDDPREVTAVYVWGHRRYGYTELDDLLPPLGSPLGDVTWDDPRPVTPQESYDYLVSISSEPAAVTPGSEGDRLAERLIEEMSNADAGGRHASAYTVLAKALQHYPFPFDAEGTVEELRVAFHKVKPDAERHEFSNMLRHLASRRLAEVEGNADDFSLDVSGVPIADPDTHEGPAFAARPQALRGAHTSQEFPVAALPDTMRTMVEMIAESAQVDAAFPALAAMGALSAATAGGYTVWLGEWEEPLALYVIGVGDPSERKSTVMRPFISANQAAQREVNADNADARAAHQSRTEELKATLAAAKKDVADDPMALTQAIVELETHEAGMDPWLTPANFTHGDVTQEALIKSMAEQNGVAWVATAEGIFINVLAGMYGGGAGIVDLSTVNDAWSGSYMRSVRVGRGDVIVEHPFLAVTAFIQPSVVDQLRDPAFTSTGFLSRVLFAAPTSMVGRRDEFLSRLIPDSLREARQKAARAAWDELVLDVLRSGWGYGGQPRRLTLAPEARTVFAAWWERAEALAASSAWWGKAHGHLARVAGVLALAEHPRTTTVTVEAMESAVEVMEWFVAQMEFLDTELLGEGGRVSVADERLGERLLRHISSKWESSREGFSVRDACRWMTVGAEEAEKAIDLLVARGWLTDAPEMRMNRRTVVPHPDLSDLLAKGRHLETPENARYSGKVSEVSEGVSDENAGGVRVSESAKKPEMTGDSGYLSEVSEGCEQVGKSGRKSQSPTSNNNDNDSHFSYKGDTETRTDSKNLEHAGNGLTPLTDVPNSPESSLIPPIFGSLTASDTTSDTLTPLTPTLTEASTEPLAACPPPCGGDYFAGACSLCGLPESGSQGGPREGGA